MTVLSSCWGTVKATVAAVACAIVLASCASGPTTSTTADSFSFTSVSSALKYAESKGYSQSAIILKDGVVTADEYRSAEQSYRQCLENQGYQFGTVVVDPVGGLRLIYQSGGTYQGPAGKADVKAINRCQDIFDTVEETYLLTHDQRMDPQLMAAVQACLAADSFTYDRSATNVKGLSGGASKIPTSVTTCVTDEARQLFPQLPGIGIGY